VGERFPHRLGDESRVWGVKLGNWSSDSKKLLAIDRYDDIAEVWDVGTETKLHAFRMPLLEGIRRYLF